MYDMYKIQLRPYKTKLKCVCVVDGEPKVGCSKCGGKGTHKRTRYRWMVDKRTEHIDNVEVMRDGSIRLWEDMQCFYEEGSKLLHMTKKGAKIECWRRNKKIIESNSIFNLKENK